MILLAVTTATADEIVQKFKNPSFSGIGTSAHYLTVENQEKSRRDEIRDDIESALKAAEREADNTTLAKFIRNLESRIYAQLSKQLVEICLETKKHLYSGNSPWKAIISDMKEYKTVKKTVFVLK